MSKGGTNRKPSHNSLVLIGRPLVEGVPWHIAFDISDREYMLFGSIIIYWSFLEHALLVRTTILARHPKVSLPDDASHHNFRRRLGAFRKLVETSIRGESTKNKWMKVIKSIERAKAGRESVAHDFWTYNPKRPDQLWATNFRRRGVRSEPFDTSKLMKLGALLGEISVELLYTRKPGYKSYQIPYFSRSARHTMMGKPRLDAE